MKALQLAFCQTSASMLREMAPVAPNPNPDTIIIAAPSRRARRDSCSPNLAP